MTAEPPARTPARAPAKLGRRGRSLWRSLAEGFDFDVHELPILEAACRQLDDIAQLEAYIAENGIISRGSKGQDRLSQTVTEVRLARGALARLLGDLAIPSEVADETAPGGLVDGPPLTARGRRAQRAAQARWKNHRRRRGGEEVV